MKKVLIEEMSWSEFKEAMAGNDLIIMPVGSLEAHGRHNPLGVDLLVAAYCAKLIGEKVGAPVAPVMPFGWAASLAGYPGTVSLDPELYRKVLFSYAESYIKHGAKRFLWINGHGGNVPILGNVAGDLYEKYGTISSFTEWWTTLKQLKEDWPCDDHGGHFETSVMMAVNPDIVDMAKARVAPTSFLSEGLAAGGYRGVSVTLPIPSHKRQAGQKVANRGREPWGANAELGKAMIQTYVDYCVGLAAELRKMKV